MCFGYFDRNFLWAKILLANKHTPASITIKYNKIIISWDATESNNINSESTSSDKSLKNGEAMKFNVNTNFTNFFPPSFINLIGY